MPLLSCSLFTVSILGTNSNMAALFCPSPRFTQCPYTLKAAPSKIFLNILILYGEVAAVLRHNGSGVSFNFFILTIN